MAVTPSYPGIYVEELPNLSHSVTAAPTSVTVFVGYSHPFKTPPDNFGIPKEIFSFGDYIANFGGFFDLDPWLPDYLGNAVFQFFQNGGSDAWVVALKPTGFLDANGTPISAGGDNATLSPAAITFDMSPGSAPSSVSVTLTAQQPGGIDPGSDNAASGTPTRVQFVNRKKSNPSGQDYDLADIVITQGTSAETYRGTAAKDIAAALALSALVTVTVTPAAAGDTPGSFPASLLNNGDLAYAAIAKLLPQVARG